MTDTDHHGPDPSDMPLLSHLLEMRNRLLKMIVAVLLVFVCLVYWANDIYLFIAEPLTENLQQGASMISIDIIAPFFTPIKTVAFVSLIIAFPYLLHQIWGFVSPGLYRKEKRFAVPLLVSSILLFYLGIAFAYFVVFPLAWQFLTSIAPAGINVTPDISSYLSIALKMFFGFGLAFEIPVATVLIVWSGIISVESLRQKRPYVIVGVFVLGMLLTPPDVISQTLLAIPMWVLFELGILFAAFSTKKSISTDAKQTEEKATKKTQNQNGTVR